MENSEGCNTSGLAVKLHHGIDGESTSNLKSDIKKVDPIVYVENPIHHEDGDSNYPLLE
jgi:hypothetical protein